MHGGTWKLITHSASRLIEILIISCDYIDSSILLLFCSFFPPSATYCDIRRFMPWRKHSLASHQFISAENVDEIE